MDAPSNLDYPLNRAKEPVAQEANLPQHDITIPLSRSFPASPPEAIRTAVICRLNSFPSTSGPSLAGFMSEVVKPPLQLEQASNKIGEIPRDLPLRLLSRERASDMVIF
ncbi:predicted protein [Histoplasma capsulatum var. duboisii H88]|uniref:Predicted protein n=2 Tax=Ajellomyces capsulatus (strain H88) TaxID=544711 RepID=F0UNZ5_AJEC8|nr:predicted protein [Histoplasma capsulatum var. duboisii H88]